MAAVFVGERRARISCVEAEMKTPAQGRGGVFRSYVKSRRRLHPLELFTNLVCSVETASHACQIGAIRCRTQPRSWIKERKMPTTLQYRPTLIDQLISNERINSYQNVFQPANDTELARSISERTGLGSSIFKGIITKLFKNLHY